MIQQNQTLSSKDFAKGLVTRADILKAQFDQSPNTMDIKWYFDGAIGKRLGSSTTNTLVIGSTGAAGWILDSSNSLNSQLQAYWKLDETSGNRQDQFGGNTLIDGNNVASITGIRGQAALFTAANSMQLFEATTSPIQTGAIDFSISTWIYLNSTSTSIQRTIISKRDPDIDELTVLLLHCDGTDASTTFTDSSPSNKSVVANGSAQVDTAQKEFGTGSFECTVGGSYLTVADSADWDFGTGDFTIDFWFRPNATGTQTLISRNGFGDYRINYDSTTLQVHLGGIEVILTSWSVSTGTWYHFALTRASSNVRAFLNGAQVGSTASNSSDINSAGSLFIGIESSIANNFNGWMDEVRISKGVARWVANFTAPVRAYGVGDYEYWLFVNTDNFVTWRVSSSGLASNAQVRATSQGALNTATWYNVVAYHSNGTHIGVTVNNLAPTTTLYTESLRVGSAPFVIGAISDGLSGRATSFFDGRVDETGFWKKVLNGNDRENLYGGGTANTYSAGASGFGWAMFDFGASNIRWLTVAAGTGIVASSNLGATFVTIATSRTQNYQYFERSKNVLVATSDSYDRTLYWAGSAGTFAASLATNSAPNAKYSINYQGFLILLNFMDSNGTIRNRGFSYADENSQLTSTWTNNFDIPSSQDDEITSSFILSKFLYISTKTRLYRVAYVGGNPDWSYLKVKDWGFVPRTAKLITLKGGQVVVGMDWNRRIRAFDGYEDVFVSDNVENNNGICEFAMKKISLAGSGLIVSHAEVDQNEQEYRLNLSIGMDSTQTTHAIVLNGRTLSLYPYSNQLYQAMCVAESAGQQHLMAVDRSGFVHILNSGNLDVSRAINDNYDSPILFGETPQQVLKSQNINAYFAVDSCGSVYYRDAVNLSSEFSPLRELVNLTGEEQKILVEKALDVPSTFNTYQFSLTSSSGSANPWKMTRWDFIARGKGLGQG